MKSELKKIAIGAMLLVTFGLPSKIVCSEIKVSEKDYVKIYDVKYKSLPVEHHKLKKLELERGVVYIYPGPYPEIHVDIGAFDSDGCGSLEYYVDNEIQGFTFFMSEDGNCCSGKNFPRQIKKIDYRSKAQSFIIPDDLNLEKGKHTLKAVVYDCNGESVEDTYEFEVK